jgi:hypothetical protein
LKRLRVLDEITFVGLLISCLLVTAEGAAYAEEAAYKFKIVDVPLHFSFQGQDRQDIVGSRTLTIMEK